MAQSNQELSKRHHRSSTKQSNDQLDQSCPICLDMYDKDHCQQTFTTCAHSFCRKCLQRTLQIKPFCPLCHQYQSSNNQDTQSRQLDDGTVWNPEVVRAHFSEEHFDENGQRMRTVHLSNGEKTNIRVSPGVKINISPNSNLIINGKRVQNPSDCNQQ
ncbi:hypothetical protein I4U23_006618 [Adineta vaga]|nr:hypothetical protein I4U23_006618 [Adineta vaga]